MPRHYVLLDACVPAAHYAPTSATSSTLKARATALVTGRSDHFDMQMLIPNFCIAEVFAVFEKYRWGHTWNKHVKKANTLSPAAFTKARTEFSGAIHNGAKIIQVELDRYHVLSVDLISPINNAYKISRIRGGDRAKERAKNMRPASTYDMLIAAMGIWLVKLHGRDNVTIVTGDRRLSDVTYRAQSPKRSKPMKDHLSQVAQRLGLAYGPDLYPEAIDLAHATKAELRGRFPRWQPEW